MTFIENIFVCLAAPLIIAVFCMHGRERRIILFLIAGMTACLLSSYISTFMAAIYGADPLSAALEISPLTEEIMKLCPVLFFIMIFEPDSDSTSEAVMMTAIGFALFENVCYMIQNGANRLDFLAVRGFSTGAMHVVCGSIVALGLTWLQDKVWLRLAGTIAFLAGAATYHGTFNILVSQTGAVAVIGYIIPVFTAIILVTVRKIRHRKR